MSVSADDRKQLIRVKPWAAQGLSLGVFLFDTLLFNVQEPNREEHAFDHENVQPMSKFLLPNS